MSDDWMFECDGEGCMERYAAVEELRGTGDVGTAEGRRIAARDGWTSWADHDLDFCPRCSKLGKS